MKASAEKSKHPDVVYYQDYLMQRPALGSNTPPVSIKASDLDKCFAAVTVIENPDEPDDRKSYGVAYKPEGTYLTNISGLPEGIRLGDIIYYDPLSEDGWVVLAAPENTTIRIKKFDVCENGQPKEYNMLVWEE
jgi:hypothetical protein